MAETCFELDLAGLFTFSSRAALEMEDYTAQETMHLSESQYVSQKVVACFFLTSLKKE